MTANRFRDGYRSDRARPLILAHRGDSFWGPENTLPAARLGHQAGADGWELDVRLASDGVPVVLHDESLARTTDAARRFEGDPRGDSGYLVGDFRLEELRTLDAGSWFVDPAGGPRTALGFGSDSRVGPEARASYRSGSVRIPTLLEALELTVGLDWLVNVELKPTDRDGEALVEAALGAIGESGAFDRVAVSSFDHAMLGLVRDREPRVATGALVDEPIDRDLLRRLRDLGFDAVHAGFGAVLEAGEAVLGAGIPVLAYTVNDSRGSGPASRLAALRVAGLFTDDPSSFAANPGLSRS